VHCSCNADGFRVVTRAAQPEAKKLWGVHFLAPDFTSGEMPPPALGWIFFRSVEHWPPPMQIHLHLSIQP
jgi:hypothetical protein